MSKIQVKRQKPQLSRRVQNGLSGCCSEQYPCLSFRYMTSSSSHSIKSLDSLDERARNSTVNAIYSRLEEITKFPWVYWLSNRKKVGLETIDYSQLTFSADRNAVASKDTTIYVFRCDTYRGRGMGRIIGFKSSPCAAYHIIGYDFDFSAYRHGN